jgi:hypothetical protein
LSTRALISLLGGTRLATTLGMNITGSRDELQGSIRVLEPLAPRPAGALLRGHGRRGRMTPPRSGRLRLAPRLSVVGGGRGERYWPVVAGRIGIAVADQGPEPDAPLIA